MKIFIAIIAIISTSAVASPAVSVSSLSISSTGTSLSTLTSTTHVSSSTTTSSTTTHTETTASISSTHSTSSVASSSSSISPTLTTSTSVTSSLGSTATTAATTIISSIATSCISTTVTPSSDSTALLDPVSDTTEPITSSSPTPSVPSTSSVTLIDGPCAAPSANSCTFYTCLEGVMGCGLKGYPYAYGTHYCLAFTKDAVNFTAAGKTWITNTMLCLQNALRKFGQGTSITCPALQKYAFGTHANCYVQNGLCTLDPRDWLEIVKVVGPQNLFSSMNAAAATLGAFGQCAKFYAWMAEQILWPVFCPFPNPFR